jgi:hypothetical protein
MALYGIAAGMGRRASIKRIERKLREKNATTRKSRVLPEEAGIISKRELGWLNHLINDGKVGRTKDGKVWWKG